MIVHVLRLQVIVLATGIISGCSLLRAAPADLSGFLPKGELLIENRSRAPFNGYWVFNIPEYEHLKNNYKKIYVAPIDTSAVEHIYNASQGSEERKRRRIQEAHELADYFKSKIELVIRTNHGQHFQIADKPGRDTFSLNLALVQVVPTKPEVNFIGTAAGFFVPGGGLINLLGEGSVAMEGLVGGKEATIDLYSQFKDREGQPYSAFSLKDYQRYAHIRAAIDAWSMQLVELLTTPEDHRVDDVDLISLNPL